MIMRNLILISIVLINNLFADAKSDLLDFLGDEPKIKEKTYYKKDLSLNKSTSKFEEQVSNNKIAPEPINQVKSNTHNQPKIKKTKDENKYITWQEALTAKDIEEFKILAIKELKSNPTENLVLTLTMVYSEIDKDKKRTVNHLKQYISEYPKAAALLGSLYKYLLKINVIISSKAI